MILVGSTPTKGTINNGITVFSSVDRAVVFYTIGREFESLKTGQQITKGYEMQSNNPLKRLSTREQVLMITMMAVGAALPGFLQEVKEEEMMSDSQILELQKLFNKFDDLAGEITEEDLKDMVLELLHEYV